MPVANDAFAQDEDWLRIPYRVTISVDAGVGMPLRPEAFNDLWNAAFPATISLGVVVIPQIEIKGWYTYASWGISEIPAKNAINYPGVTDIDGGGVKTTMYGASAKVIALPNSRIMPYLEVGGGYFTASGDDLIVTEDGAEIFSNSMEDASGPVFTIAGGMQYGVNERWDVFTEFNYYMGFSDDFSPGSLVQRSNATDPADAGNLHIATIVLGLTLKL
jgi:opacity protein-like surface antigen